MDCECRLDGRSTWDPPAPPGPGSPPRRAAPPRLRASMTGTLPTGGARRLRRRCPGLRRRSRTLVFTGRWAPAPMSARRASARPWRLARPPGGGLVRLLRRLGHPGRTPATPRRSRQSSRSNRAGVVRSTKSRTTSTKRAGSVWCGKCPASSKISSSLPGKAAWARRPCPSGMMASRRPQMIEGRHALGQVGPVEHGDDLALPVHARTQRAQDGPPGLGVGQGVEHGQDLLGVAARAPYRGCAAARRPGGSPTGPAGARAAGISASAPGTAARRSSGLTVRPDPARCPPAPGARSVRGTGRRTGPPRPPPSEWPTTVDRSISRTLRRSRIPLA